MTRTVSLCLLLASFCATPFTKADTTSATFVGSFANDASLFTYNFTDTAAEVLNFYTTSYAGGTNANGTVTTAGGFVPVLTLFSNSTGNAVGFGGGGGACNVSNPSTKADATTKLCEDASFVAALTAGSYTLILSEFPNVPTGNLSSPGFLAAGDTTFTGDNCGAPRGTFLEADLAPCVQRTANYAVNISPAAAATPEPSSLILLLLPAAAMLPFARRQIA